MVSNPREASFDSFAISHDVVGDLDRKTNFRFGKKPTTIKIADVMAILDWI